MPTVADVIADALIEAEVDTVFGLPGGEVVALLDAFRARDIRFVLVHNEASALFMADATARLSGRPAVALATLGPGATNAVVGVAHAYLDRSPVILLAAQMPARLRSHHTHQTVDLRAVFRPITKASVALSSVGARDTVRDALMLAIAGRPGPVHLELDGEVAISEAVEGPSGLPAPISPSGAMSSGDDDIERAVQLLRQAKRPLVLMGLGRLSADDALALRELAEAAGAPVITTPKGKGAVPEDHALFCGSLGVTRTDPAYEVLEEADCILAVGFDVVELVRPWAAVQPLVWIAAWDNADPQIETSADCTGPVARTLRALAAGARSRTQETTSAWGTQRVARFRDASTAQPLPAPSSGRMLPQTVVETARRVFPRSVRLAVDVGSHKILACLAWRAFRPQSFLVSNGLSCMGYGLPAAMAAAMQDPESPSLCFMGDAGFAMVVGELRVLKTLQLPVVVIVFTDGAIDLIRSHQRRQGFEVFGTEFEPPDHVAIARAYGVAAERVETEQALEAALRAAVASRKPTLIDAQIDPVSYPTTPLPRVG